MLALIVCLLLTAYINGLLIGGKPTRFLAAIYNLFILTSGFIMLKAVREQIKSDAVSRMLLKCCFIAFVGMTAVVWSCVVIAYALNQFALEVPSLFGLLFGRIVPDSAPLIRDSTVLTFTRPDWGLPGVPMPRISVYGPYPTATAATVAVLGSMALLFLQKHGRWRRFSVPAFEILLIVTIATTLTRSVLGGWVMGAIVANLIFGTPIRRILASAALICALIAVPYAQDTGKALEYRAYSSESRFENYLYAVEKTFHENPVFGLGIKPREAGKHIAVGSHSTFVSFFTKGGGIAFSLVVAFFVLTPLLRWFVIIAVPTDKIRRSKAELRILLNLQIAIWVWMCFEDIDAPASAALLIFISWAFIEQGLRVQVGGRSHRPMSTEKMPASGREESSYEEI
ncbi:hypothetical protein O2N63_11210 [Aliiroseovarius sp. KMU-50]|uniref:O-antigen ligase-related domain-containing protein n=1 Tax=Aliiroseovarius salicola TaxID=3009082 RepID=A0ABT4W4I2_9RHOB|nr:O-antigen ligase family protein [Aliiroseovarius sp. KMU-50]MDA5094653.1 hypothetical protein [Aliiroseovarius sp. KMU-50]